MRLNLPTALTLLRIFLAPLLVVVLLTPPWAMARVREQVQDMASLSWVGDALLWFGDWREIVAVAIFLIFVERPEVEPTNNRSERNVRREAEIRKGGRTSKTPTGAKRRGVIMTVMASLQTRFAKFTLDVLLAEVERWIVKGCSRFESELASLEKANPPPPGEPAICPSG